MNFKTARAACVNGQRVRRKGWPKDSFLTNITKEGKEGKKYHTLVITMNKELARNAEAEGGELEHMKAPTPWLESPADLKAEDWEAV